MKPSPDAKPALAFLTGSYDPADCRFLLQAIDAPMLSVEDKERQLQSGKQHYSEMISLESPPSQQYLTVFHSLVDKYRERLAQEMANLAAQVYALKGKEITVISLARAGTPVGVLLTRALRHYYKAAVTHYSVSIVRDRGIDEQALTYIEQAGHSAESIIFVDGWTAKGIITQELKAAIAHWNQRHTNYPIPNDLCVISDIGGTADIIATTEDYAIPSGILNSTVSGLVSRSLLLDQYAGFHQCVLYSTLAEHDLSNWFVDQISGLFPSYSPQTSEPISVETAQRRRHKMLNYVEALMKRYSVIDINRVKPGIAEATRVMLRRIPRVLLVRDIHSDNVAHLLVLAKEKNIEVIEDATMPFNAVALIADVKG